jgi:hypothetical protein
MEDPLCASCEQNLVCPLAYVRLQECLNRYKLPQGDENDRFSDNVGNSPDP